MYFVKLTADSLSCPGPFVASEDLIYLK